MKVVLQKESAFQKDRHPGNVYEDERGWALLGMILALSILSIVLVSSVAPNVAFQVRRDKEAEMIYRGEQMAEGIARYYGNGTLVPLTIQQPPPYGYLLDLKKLRDGVTVGVVDKKFVRASAMIDALTSEEWEPVRLRDPRIANALQVYSTQPDTVIPQSYMLLAGPPAPLKVIKPATGSDSNPPGGQVIQPTQPSGSVSGGNQQDSDDSDDTDDNTDGTDGNVGTNPGITNPGSTGNVSNQGQRVLGDAEEKARDPFAHFFEDGKFSKNNTNLPIVGVATKMKGKSIRSYKGLNNYEEWVFIYVPKVLELQRSATLPQTNPIQPTQTRRQRRNNP